MHALRRVAVLLSLAAVAALCAPPDAAAIITSRFAHTTTMLPNGDLLVVGGAQCTGGPTENDCTTVTVLSSNQVEIVDGENGLTSAGAAFATNVASHTATLMGNGEVLIAGGRTSGGASAALQVYDPVHNCWRTTTPSMTTRRYHHTATLLNNGNVLLCGGQGGALAADVNSLASCEVFVPNTPNPAETNCATSGGSLGTGVTMQAPRALHTATLLADGRVWLAGGFDNTGFSPLSTYLSSTELATAGSANTASAASLITARAMHRATLMGNGKVLVTGGYRGPINPTNLCSGNPCGFNVEKAGSRGILDTTEIYDAIGNSVSPGGVLPVRMMEHGQVLNGDGSVTIFGGLGNLTTNYFDPSTVINSTWSFLRGCMESKSNHPGGSTFCANTGTFSGFRTDARIADGYVEIPLNLTMSPEVTGVIQDGFVLFSTSTIIFEGGRATLHAGWQDADTGALKGTWATLAGQAVGCDSSGTCGKISDQIMLPDLNVAPNSVPAVFTGSYTITPLAVTAVDMPFIVAVSTVDWDDVTIEAGGPTNTTLCADGGISGNVTFTGLSNNFIGAQVTSATFQLTDGNLTLNDALAGGGTGEPAYTISLDQADVNFRGNGGAFSLPRTVFLDAGTGTGAFTVRMQLSNLVGTVSAITPTAQVPGTSNGGCDGDVGQDVSGLSLTNIAGILKFNVNKVNLNQGTENFTIDIATAVVRKMLFADQLQYTPTLNSWSYASHSTSGRGEIYGQTASLTPSNTMRNLGGRRCEPPAASGFNIRSCRLDDDDETFSIISILPPWTATSGTMSARRANGTSTLLPNGKILIAGGSNGPNILSTAELYDPATLTFSPTGPMNHARDLHTATLLPDGRVLVAGGFSTSATSTGSITSAEIYYPDTGVWLETSPMPFAADSHAAVLLSSGVVLVAGGFSNGVYLASAAIFDPKTNAWTSIPDMRDDTGATTGTHGKRAGHTATLLQDGRVLITGGLNQTGTLCSAIIYDPTVTTIAGAPWFDIPDIGNGSGMNCAVTAVHGHSATLLRDGNVLVAGGNNPLSGEVNNAFIYVPGAVPNPNNAVTNGIWLHVPTDLGGNQVNRRRFKHAAIAAPNGKVFLIGGAESLGSAVNDVETYDPASSTFTLHGPLNTGRFGSMAVLTNDGYITIFGGSDGVQPIQTAERSYFASVPDSVSLGVPPGSRKPVLTSVDVNPFRGFSTQNTILNGNPRANGPHVTILGTGMRGVGEAAGGGAGSGNSSFHNPRVILQAAGGSGTQSGIGGFQLELSTRIYARPSSNPNVWASIGSSITLQMPSWVDAAHGGRDNPGRDGMVPFGWHQLRVYSNAVFSDALMVQVGPPKPRAAPGPVSATILSSTSIQWTWSQGSTPTDEMNGFNVYSSTTGIFSTHTLTGLTTFTENNLAPNTTASIMVAAYTASGNGPLAYSATYYTFASTPVVTSPIVAAFSNIGFNTIQLNWNAHDNTPATVYEIYQSTDATNIGQPVCAPTLADPPCHNNCPAGCPFSVNITTPVPTLLQTTTTTAVIGFLQPNTTYSFQIRAFNGAGIPSNFSMTVTTRTLSPVSNLTGVAQSPTAIQWNWLDPGGVLYYNIYNATVAAGAPGVIIATTSLPTFNDTGLSINTPRVVRVSAVTTAGEGPLSPSATVYTLAAVPGVVNPAIPNVTTGSYDASWTANGNPLFTQYRLVTLDIAGLGISTLTTTAFNLGFGLFLNSGNPFIARVDALNGDGISSGFLVLGTSATAATAPQTLTIAARTPDSVSFTWDNTTNHPSVIYEVTYTTAVSFADIGAIRTAVPFSSGFSAATATVSGLQTSSTYSFRVQGRNLSNVGTAFSNIVTTSPFNGGVPQGSLGASVVGALGATFSGSIGGGRPITVNIPPNAFPSDTFVTISTFDAAGVNSKCSGGVDIGVRIVTNPSLQPVKPIFLTIGYSTELMAIPAGQVALNRVDDLTGTCVPLSTVLDTANQTLTAQLNHFSLFQVANVPPAGDVGQAEVFPNPFKPSSGNGYVTFKNMPSGSQVRVFNLKGQLAWEGTANGSGLLTWTGINRFGRPVASGIYLAVIEDSGQKKILKVAVLR